MMVGIDAGPMIGRGGISEYAGPLIRHLVADDKINEYRLVFRRSWSHLSTLHVFERMAPVIRLPIPDRLMSWWWEHLDSSLPVGRRLWKSLDLYLSTCLMSPILPQGKVISLVYDLIPLRLPALFPRHAEFREQLRGVCARSSALVAISHRTKDDLVELLDIDAASIHVIYPGCRSASASIAPTRIGEVALRHGIVGPYILYVGSLGRHKNVEALLRAYQLVLVEGKVAATLVIAGKPDQGHDILLLAEELGIDDRLRFTDYVSEDDLLALYAGADLFVFPSLYEGFGLPVLEAMACGTPVIVSKAGALPEVIGEAGLAVNAEDPRAFGEAIITVMGNEQLRLDMKEAGLHRAQQFSWSRSADQLRDLMNQMAGGLP